METLFKNILKLLDFGLLLFRSLVDPERRAVLLRRHSVCLPLHDNLRAVAVRPATALAVLADRVPQRERLADVAEVEPADVEDALVDVGVRGVRLDVRRVRTSRQLPCLFALAHESTALEKCC